MGPGVVSGLVPRRIVPRKGTYQRRICLMCFDIAAKYKGVNLQFGLPKLDDLTPCGDARQVRTQHSMQRINVRFYVYVIVFVSVLVTVAPVLLLRRRVTLH